MSIQVQVLLIVGSILFFIYLLSSIRKSKLNTDLAVIWVMWGFGVIIISIFPQIVYKITYILGIMAPINTIFLLMIFLLYSLTFYLYIKISVIEDQLKNVIHEISLMKKDDHEKNNE